MRLFVGLGNPGKAYEGTRHNIGFEVIDALVDHFRATQISSSFSGILYKKDTHLFLKPTTYMNRSGESVNAVARFYKINTSSIVVIHDDIDLPFGALRIKKGGGHGGHNGLRSIDETMGDREYVRVRMGVGKPTLKNEVASYVLSHFNPEQKGCKEAWITHALHACKALLELSITEVSSRYTIKSIKSLCP